MEKILKNIVFYGLLISPFLMLVVTSSLFFPYITGKNFGFRILTEIVFFAWLILAFFDSQYRPKWNWLLVVMTSFVAVIFLADILGVYPYKSLWSNFERMEGFVTIFHLWMYFVVLVSYLRREMWGKFMRSWVISGLLVSIYALMQMWGIFQIHQGGVRVDATFGNAAYLAVFMIFSVFIALIHSIKAEDKKWKFAFLALALLELVVLYNTATRGAILGILGGLILSAVLVVVLDRENSRYRNYAKIATILLLSVIVSFFLFKDTQIVQKNQVLGRFSSISLEETTTKSRFLVWKMAWEGFKERPVLGWGQENFNYVFNKNYHPQMYAQEQWFDRTHNVVLDWLVAGGLLGTLLYLSIYGFTLYYLWKSPLSRLEKSLLTGLFAAYFINNLFVFDNLGSYLFFFSVLAYIYSCTESQPFWNKKYEKGTVERLLLPLCVVLLLLSLYQVNFKAIQQGRTLISALTPQVGQFDKNLELFKKALAYNSFGSQEAREYLLETANEIGRSNSVTLQIKQAFFSLALAESNRQISLAPQDARHYVFAGSFLSTFGLPAQAISYYEKALELSPNKQSILFGLGSAYLADKEEEKALQVFKLAYELAPQSNEAKIIYAAGLIYNQRISEAQELLNFETVTVADNRISRALLEKEEHAKAVAYTQSAINNNPTFLDNYISLAAIYSQIGEKEKAVGVLNEAATANPSFKAQADYYIGEIKAVK